VWVGHHRRPGHLAGSQWILVITTLICILYWPWGDMFTVDGSTRTETNIDTIIGKKDRFK
jgi:hypothetical protein